MPQQTGQTTYPVTGSKEVTSAASQKLFAAYDAICNIEEKIDRIEESIVSSFPKSYDMCNIMEFVEKIQGIVKDLTSLPGDITAILSSILSESLQLDINLPNTDTPNVYTPNTDFQNTDTPQGTETPNLSIDSKYTPFVALKIILKKFQILKLRIEMIKTNVEIILAKTIKKILVEILKGKGSAANPILAVPMTVIQALSQAINAVIQVINMIITVLSCIPIITVDAASMCFFMTPKSMNTTKMQTMNVNQSINNTIPDPIAKAIATVQQKINEANGVLKKSKIATMAAAGAATAGINFDPGQFGALTQFDPKVIYQAVKAILVTLLDAEPVPRYEKLSIINIRFLVWLTTGFVPAGYKSFGIPGYP